MKKVIIILLCLVLTGCSEKEDSKKYEVSRGFDKNNLNACINYLNSIGIKATEDFCYGKEEIIINNQKMNFQTFLDSETLTESQLEYLENNKVIECSNCKTFSDKLLDWLDPLFRFFFSLL